ncbi:formate dehydrogenase [Ramlibacter sp. PS4R-6]|uniref:formate dehydrogenase n=1 Tax=Ramlibacter sp. PS4R-6 TaxID=3133438 RepID=UPI0030B571CB
MSQAKAKLSRRTLFAGAGTATALAAAATVLPRIVEQEAPLPEAKPAPARGGGYQLTDHVKQYYKTTRI